MAEHVNLDSFIFLFQKQEGSEGTDERRRTVPPCVAGTSTLVFSPLLLVRIFKSVYRYEKSYTTDYEPTALIWLKKRPITLSRFFLPRPSTRSGPSLSSPSSPPRFPKAFLEGGEEEAVVIFPLLSIDRKGGRRGRKERKREKRKEKRRERSVCVLGRTLLLRHPAGKKEEREVGAATKVY